MYLSLLTSNYYFKYCKEIDGYQKNAFYSRLYDWNFMSAGNTKVKDKRIIKKYIKNIF